MRNARPAGFPAPLAASLLVFWGLTACHSDSPPPQAAGDPPAVAVAKPLVKEVVEWDEYTARLAAVEEVEVRARVSGYLESISFTEGSVVQEGDLLMTIDPRPFQAEVRQREAQVKQAQAAASNARTQFNRAKQLRQSKSISEEEYQLRRTTAMGADADVQSALAAVESARLNLEFTEVRAPISGRIGRTFIDEGNLVHGGSGDADLLTRIVSLDPIHAYFEASERAYLKYVRLARTGKRTSSREVRNPVFLQLADETGFPHRGYMDFVDNVLDRNTGTMTGRAIVPNPDLVLVPGLFARARLPGSGVADALLIPDAAVGSDQTQKFVFVVGEDNKVAYRKIAIGPIVHGLRVVRAGLTPDDRIVTVGVQRVRPGQSVSPQPADITVLDEPLTPADAAPVQVADHRSGN